MIRALEGYWADQGCVLMQPYHTELAAGTMNPATFLRCLGPKPWKTAYVEPVIRPQDGRYGENPYRFQHYFQYQVILKPAPEDVLDRYFESLESLGIDLRRHDVRLVEDDREQPTLGPRGLEWSAYNFELAPVDALEARVDQHEQECRSLVERGLPLPAYDHVLKCSHAFNLLDARGAISVTERAAYIGRVRTLAREVAQLYLE